MTVAVAVPGVGARAAGGGSAASSGAAPCAACKLLRRRCAAGCVFAPYFPPGEPHKFANVHKVFGASNVSKLLQVCAPTTRFLSSRPVARSCHRVWCASGSGSGSLLAPRLFPCSLLLQ